MSFYLFSLALCAPFFLFTHFVFGAALFSSHHFAWFFFSLPIRLSLHIQIHSVFCSLCVRFCGRSSNFPFLRCRVCVPPKSNKIEFNFYFCLIWRIVYAECVSFAFSTQMCLCVHVSECSAPVQIVNALCPIWMIRLRKLKSTNEKVTQTLAAVVGLRNWRYFW